MNEVNDYIKFDIRKITELEDIYESSMEFILESLPDINYNSINQVCDLVNETLGSSITNIRIETLKSLQNKYQGGDAGSDLLDYLIAFLRLKYTLRNYIRCILRHHKEGVVVLRNVAGEICLPNKQPLSYNEEIISCIIDQSPAALAATKPLF